MMREGRVRGKSTNKSRVTGRCSFGKKRCRDCGDHPVEKARQKRRGRRKRFRVPEFLLQPSPKQLRDSSLRDLVYRELDERRSADDHADEDVVQGITSVVVEAAFSEMHGGYGDDMATDETTAMAFTTFEPASGAILVGDGTDISAIKEAFQRELGIFENAVEGSSFSETHFARKWGSVLSEESWSDVEFLESELEISSEDDDSSGWRR